MSAVPPQVPTQRVPPTPNVAFLVMAVGRQVRERVEARLTEHGLTIRHVSALGHLASEPGLSYSELARRASVAVQSMKATIAHLESIGAVERHEQVSRGRRARLRLTEFGEKLLRAGRAALDDAQTHLLTPFDPADQDLITSMLSTMFRAGLTVPAGAARRLN